VLVPGTADRTPSSLVIDRSDWGVSVSVSVALLLAGLVSVTSAGGVMVAVLVNEPGAEGAVWAVEVKGAVALTGRSTVVARAPAPVPAPATAPPPLLSLTVQLAAVTPAGSGSDTLAPVTSLGPRLLTTMMYVSDVPGTTDVTLSVLEMAKSA